MLDAKLHEFKKSLNTQHTVESTESLDLTIEQIIQLLEISGIIPEDAEDLEVYYGDGNRSLPMEEHLAFRWES